MYKKILTCTLIFMGTLQLNPATSCEEGEIATSMFTDAFGNVCFETPGQREEVIKTASGLTTALLSGDSDLMQSFLRSMLLIVDTIGFMSCYPGELQEQHFETILGIGHVVFAFFKRLASVTGEDGLFEGFERLMEISPLPHFTREMTQDSKKVEVDYDIVDEANNQLKNESKDKKTEKSPLDTTLTKFEPFTLLAAGGARLLGSAGDKIGGLLNAVSEGIGALAQCATVVLITVKLQQLFTWLTVGPAVKRRINRKREFKDQQRRGKELDRRIDALTDKLQDELARAGKSIARQR